MLITILIITERDIYMYIYNNTSCSDDCTLSWFVVTKCLQADWLCIYRNVHIKHAYCSINCTQLWQFSRCEIILLHSMYKYGYVSCTFVEAVQRNFKI